MFCTYLTLNENSLTRKSQGGISTGNKSSVQIRPFESQVFWTLTSWNVSRGKHPGWWYRPACEPFMFQMQVTWILSMGFCFPLVCCLVGVGANFQVNAEGNVPLLHCTERCSKKPPQLFCDLLKAFFFFFLSNAITVGLWHVVIVYQPTAQKWGIFCCWLQTSPLLSIAPRASLDLDCARHRGTHTG